MHSLRGDGQSRRGAGGYQGLNLGAPAEDLADRAELGVEPVDVVLKLGPELLGPLIELPLELGSDLVDLWAGGRLHARGCWRVIETSLDGTGEGDGSGDHRYDQVAPRGPRRARRLAEYLLGFALALAVTGPLSAQRDRELDDVLVGGRVAGVARRLFDNRSHLVICLALEQIERRGQIVCIAHRPVCLNRDAKRIRPCAARQVAVLAALDAGAVKPRRWVVFAHNPPSRAATVIPISDPSVGRLLCYKGRP